MTQNAKRGKTNTQCEILYTKVPKFDREGIKTKTLLTHQENRETNTKETNKICHARQSVSLKNCLLHELYRHTILHNNNNRSQNYQHTEISATSTIPPLPLNGSCTVLPIPRALPLWESESPHSPFWHQCTSTNPPPGTHLRRLVRVRAD